MRKLILKTSLSIDGFVGGPNGEIDWIFETDDEDATQGAEAPSHEAAVGCYVELGGTALANMSVLTYVVSAWPASRSFGCMAK